MWKSIDKTNKNRYNEDVIKRKGCYQCTVQFKLYDLIISEEFKIIFLVAVVATPDAVFGSRGCPDCVLDQSNRYIEFNIY